ncbi:MAG: hypothetical protein JNK49_02290 [Planctomycetes bacterium]|nr:hypothetical protein [Planctomycetota bacterium]
MSWRVAAALALAGCSNLQVEHGPATLPSGCIAVLPFTGSADPALRATARSLWQARLAARGHQVAALAWVDQQLAEHGWLTDPDTFAPPAMPLPQLAAALGVAALAFGSDFTRTDWNAVLLRSEAVAGTVTLWRADGARVARATHRAGGLGGFALGSGRVLDEFAAQRAQGTPQRVAAQLDELVEGLAAALPAAPARTTAAAAMATDATARRVGTRLWVTARAEPLDHLWFRAGNTTVPMAPAPDRAGWFVGALDLAEPVDSIQVLARNAQGQTTTTTVTP